MCFPYNQSMLVGKPKTQSSVGMKTNSSACTRCISLGMSAIFLYVHVVYGAIEPAKNLWEERREAFQNLRVKGGHRAKNLSNKISPAKVPMPEKENTLLAQLPSINLSVLSNSIPKTQNLGRSSKRLTLSLSQYGGKNSEKLPNRSPNQPLPKWLKSIPMSYVNLKEMYLPPSWKPSDLMVIHIQDAHDNHEAQLNIARVIESLSRSEVYRSADGLKRLSKSSTHDSDLPAIRKDKQRIIVGVEGARGAFNFLPYRSFPDKEITREIARYFLKESFISGPEYVGMTLGLDDETAGDNPSILFWGIEDEELYLRHVKSFKNALPVEKEAKSLHQDLKSSIHALKAKVFAKELKELDQKITEYHQGEIGLGEYLKHLTKGKVPAKSSEISRFLQALSLEESMDYDQVERQRSELTKRLAGRLPKNELKNLVATSLSYRMGQLSYGAFYQYIKELCSAYGVSLSQWPQMERYIQYVLLSDKMKSELLFEEINDLEKRRINSLTKTEKEKALVELSKDLMLVGRLIGFSLSPEEWGSFQDRKQEIRKIVQRIQKLAHSIRKGEEKPEIRFDHRKASTLQDYLISFENFNEAAIVRDKVLVNNLLQKARDSIPEMAFPLPEFLVHSVKTKKKREILGRNGRLEHLVLEIGLKGRDKDSCVDVVISAKDAEKPLGLQGTPVTQTKFLDYTIKLYPSKASTIGKTLSTLSSILKIQTGGAVETNRDEGIAGSERYASPSSPIRQQASGESVTKEAGQLAILVAGGFHTKGITELLKEKQVAYAVLTPHLGKVEGEGSDYLEIFRRDKTPLEELFTGERITLKPEGGIAASPMANPTIARVIPNLTVAGWTSGKVIRTAKELVGGANKENLARAQKVVNSHLSNVRERSIPGKKSFRSPRIIERAVSAFKAPTVQTGDGAQTSTLPILYRLFWFLPPRIVDILVSPILELPITILFSSLAILGLSRLSQSIINKFLEWHSGTPDQWRQRKIGIRWLIRGTGIGFVFGVVIAIIGIYVGIPLPDILGQSGSLASAVTVALKSGALMGAIENGVTHSYYNFRYRDAPLSLLQKFSRAAAKHSEVNEDALFAEILPNGLRIAGVFDGMGGHGAGDKASGIARDVVWNALKTLTGLEQEETIIKLLGQAMKGAADWISLQLPGSEAGTTATVAVMVPQADGTTRVIIANAGDSRAYIRESDERLESLTVDNLKPEDVQDQLVMNREEARNRRESSNQPFLSSVEREEYLDKVENGFVLFKLNNIVKNVLIEGHPYKPVITVETMQPGSALILTTDGVHDNLTDKEIQEIVAKFGESEALAQELVRRSRERADDRRHIRAKDDDMTAVVIHTAQPARPEIPVSGLSDIETFEQLYDYLRRVVGSSMIKGQNAEGRINIIKEVRSGQLNIKYVTRGIGTELEGLRDKVKELLAQESNLESPLTLKILYKLFWFLHPRVVELIISPIIEMPLTLLGNLFVDWHGGQTLDQKRLRKMGIRWILKSMGVGFFLGAALSGLLIYFGAPLPSFLGQATDLTSVFAAILKGGVLTGIVGNIGAHFYYSLVHPHAPLRIPREFPGDSLRNKFMQKLPQDLKRKILHLWPEARLNRLEKARMNFEKLEELEANITSDKFAQEIKLIRLMMLSDIFGMESRERKSQKGETIIDLLQLSRIVGHMSQEEIFDLLSALRKLYETDLKRAETSSGAFVQKFFKSGGQAERAAELSSGQPTQLNFEDAFKAYKGFVSVIAPDSKVSGEQRQAAKRAWEDGRKRAEELSNLMVLEASKLIGFKKDSVQAGSVVANVFDFSSLSTDKVTMLTQQIVMASEAQGNVIIPIITNQNIEADLAKAQIKDQVENDLQSQGYSQEKIARMFKKVEFGEIVITGKDLRNEQDVDPMIEMDTEAVYRILQREIRFLKNYPDSMVVPIQLFTDNIQRFKERWNGQLKLQILIILSSAQVIVATQDIAESLKARAVLAVQQ